MKFIQETYRRYPYKEKHRLPFKAVVRDLVRIRGYAEISVIYHVQIQTIRDWIQ